MLRVNENTLQELVTQVEEFTALLKKRDIDYALSQRDRDTIRDLTAKNEELTQRMQSVEYKTSVAKITDLESRESNLKASLKLEYDKGYAAAYTEVTNKMKV